MLQSQSALTRSDLQGPEAQTPDAAETASALQQGTALWESIMDVIKCARSCELVVLPADDMHAGLGRSSPWAE